MASTHTDIYGQVYSAIIGASASNIDGNTARISATGALNYSGSWGAAYGYNGVGGRLYINGIEVGNCVEPNYSWTGTINLVSRTKDIARTHSAQSIPVAFSYYSGNYYGMNGDTISASINVTIDAKPSYTVSYNANGGSGAPSSQTKWYDETLVLSTGIPSRTGYAFKGWSTTSGGSVSYSPGSSYTSNNGQTLYAVWEAQSAKLDSVSNVTLGNACSVKWTPITTAYRYKLTFAIGSFSYTTDYISVSSTSQYHYTSYTIPVTVAQQIPNSVTGNMTVTLTTYNGSTSLGTDSKTMVITVPSSVVPSFSSATVTAVNTNTVIAQQWSNIFVGGYTKARCRASATGSQGSTISSISVSGAHNHTGTTSLDSTSDVLDAGSKTFTFTVTDSRGRTASTTVTKTFFTYNVPELTSFSASRTNVVSVVQALATWTYSNLGSNTVTPLLQYKTTGGSYQNVSGSITSGTTKTLTEVFNDGVSYFIKLRVTDSLGNYAENEVYIPTVEVSLSFPNTGHGVGIGKICESAKLEVGYDTEFFEDATFDGDVSVTGDTTMSGDLSVSGGVVNLGNKVGINENNPSYTLDVQSSTPNADPTMRLGSLDLRETFHDVGNAIGMQGWNQLIPTHANQTLYGVTLTQNANGSITLSGTSTSNSCIFEMTNSIMSTHKFLLKTDDKLLPDCYLYNNSAVSSGDRVIGREYGGTAVIFAPSQYAKICIQVLSGTAINFTFVPQLFDLTALFGSGNEPITVAEFKQLFNADYYPYCQSGDFIVEQGRDGDWTYRKWNSGIAECWMRKTESPVTNWSAWGYSYEATPPIGRETFPSGLFLTAPCTSVLCQLESGSASMSSEVGFITKDYIDGLYVVRPSVGSTGMNQILHIHAIGVWK